MLLSCPTQPQIMPQQMQLAKAIQTWRPASLGSPHPGQLTKGSPRQDAGGPSSEGLLTS